MPNKVTSTQVNARNDVEMAGVSQLKLEAGSACAQPVEGPSSGYVGHGWSMSNGTTKRCSSSP